MRNVLVLSLVMIGAGAQASFDMMLLPISGDSRVARFDPVNRIFLGTVGTEGGQAIRTANLGPNGTVNLTGGGGTNQFNHSSGEFVLQNGAFNASGAAHLGGTRIFEAFNTLIYAYNSTTLDLTVGAVSSGLDVLASIIPLSDNLVIAYGTNLAGNFVSRRVNMSSGTSSNETLLALSANFGGVASIGTGFSRQSGGGFRTYITSRTTTSDIVQEFGFDSAGTYILLNTMSLNGFSATAPKSVMPGHNGYWIVGDDSALASSTRITQFGNQNVQVGSYTTSLVNVPSTRFKGANIVAPEPGSMIAIAVGLAAMLKRRRKAIV